MARETEKGSGSESEKRRARESRGLAAERDRQVRIRSVANDTRLNLPVSIPMPDGEEFPGTHLQLRSYDQRAEIQRGYIQGPPNKTICDSSEWIDWETSDVRSSMKDGKSSSNNSSNSSKGQLWGLKLSSGKSPPCHSRPTRDHQRHSNSSSSKTTSSSGKHKNSSNSSSSSSTCSSTSSSTSSFTGLGGGILPALKPVTTTSFGEKLQTVFSPSSNGSESCRTSPNNNSSSGVFSRLIDETKRATRSSSAKSGKKQIQQQQQQGVSNPNPNPCGAGTTKVISITTTSSMMTRSSMTTIKCDVQQQQQQIPPKKMAGFFHQTFSERVEEGSPKFRDSSSTKSSMMTLGSDSDNNGNGNNAGGGSRHVTPHPRLGGGSPSASAPSSFTPKTDDSQSKQLWNNPTLFVKCGGQRSNHVVDDSFGSSSQSQTTVQNNVSDLMMIPSDTDNLGLQSPLTPNPIPPAPQNFAPTPHQNQYSSSSSSDVELVDQRL